MSSEDDLVTATKNLVIATNNLGQILKQTLPYVQSTAATASVGAGGALPATVRNYWVFIEPSTGVTVKIPTFEV